MLLIGFIIVLVCVAYVVKLCQEERDYEDQDSDASSVIDVRWP